MSKTTTITLPIVELEHPSGNQLSSIAYSTDWFIGQTSDRLAERFKKAARSKLLQQGEYFALLPYVTQQTPSISTINVSLPASKERFDPQPQIISLPVVIWQGKDDSIVAMLPSLGVGYHSKTSEGYQEQLQTIALLTLKREKRLLDAQRLITAHWYQQVNVHYETIDLEFYTPNELEAFQVDQKEPLLPKTAVRMSRSQHTFFGLKDKLQMLSDSLQGEYCQSVLLVGPSGCGKTALVQAYEQQVGKQWQQKPWLTSAARLLQVLTEEGSWQYGLGQWLNELRDRGEVVYLGNLAEWFEVGQYSGNAISIGEALRDALSRNDILVIAELTQEQLDVIELRHPGYRQLFQVIEFTDDVALTRKIAKQAVASLATQHKYTIEEHVLDVLQDLQRRYMPYSGYPGKTIRFFESLILQHQEPVIDLNKTLSAFCEDTGMPLFLVDGSTALNPKQLEQQLASGVIGQDGAIDELVEAVLTTKAGMAKLGRPIMSLLFVGPTGVGKTQLAKMLASTIFNDAKRLLRFDMSEYSDPYAVGRLTSMSESSLVSKVRQQPFSVVLFDEIEKAAHNFFDLLLQILGEGRLTDDQGNIANFCSTIIIMTSNLGAKESMQASMGFTSRRGQMNDHFEAAVTKHFRPELFNRIDRIVPFSPLSSTHQAKIIQKEVYNLLASPGIAHRKVSIDIDDSVWQWLHTLNIDFRYGARAIQRQLQQRLISPLAEALCLESTETPMTLALSVVKEQLVIAKTIHNDSQKSLGAFSEFADQVAVLRRQMSYLSDSNSWIHLLSSIDQLEQRKTRKKQHFWSNVDDVNHYTELNKLKQAYQQQVADVVAFESLCLSQYQEQTVAILWQDYHQQLAHYQQVFMQLLKDSEAYINPENNKLVLGCYGTGQLLTEMDVFYKSIIKHYQWQCTRYNVYYVKQAHMPAELANILNVEPTEIDLNQSEEPIDYWRSIKPLTHDLLMKTGYLYQLSGPCIAHYLSQESGLVESVVGSQKNRVFIDLSKGHINEHRVPDGIERKEFYKAHKCQRKIEGQVYTDTRFHKDQALALAQHVAELETLSQRLLHNKLTAKPMTNREERS